MESTDLTLQVLIEIREQIVKVEASFATLTKRVDAGFTDLGRRIDQTNRQLLVTEARLATDSSY